MVLAVLGAACSSGDPYAGQYRGHGLVVSALPPREVARIYESAAAAAFVAGTPLLLDPQYLPRGEGWNGGDRMPFDIVSTLRGRGIMGGMCAPSRGEKAVPVCDATEPGYVLRFSPVFELHGDTVQVYVGAVRYRTSHTAPSEALRMERAYQLEGGSTGGAWHVTKEARLAAP